jgi:hypothetical protein
MYLCIYECIYYVPMYLCMFLLCMYLCKFLLCMYLCMFLLCMYLCTYECIMYICMYLCTYECIMYVCIYACRLERTLLIFFLVSCFPGFLTSVGVRVGGGGQIYAESLLPPKRANFFFRRSHWTEVKAAVFHVNKSPPGGKFFSILPSFVIADINISSTQRLLSDGDGKMFKCENNHGERKVYCQATS